MTQSHDSAPRIPVTRLNSYSGQKVTLVGSIDENKPAYSTLKTGSGVATLKGRDFPVDRIIQVQGMVDAQMQVQVDDLHVYDYTGTMDDSLKLYEVAIQ